MYVKLMLRSFLHTIACCAVIFSFGLIVQAQSSGTTESTPLTARRAAGADARSGRCHAAQLAEKLSPGSGGNLDQPSTPARARSGVACTAGCCHGCGHCYRSYDHVAGCILRPRFLPG